MNQKDNRIIKEYKSYAEILLHPRLEYSTQDYENILMLRAHGGDQLMICDKRFPGVLVDPNDVIAVLYHDILKDSVSRMYVYFTDDPYVPVLCDAGSLWETKIRFRDATALCYPLISFETARRLIAKENYVRFGMSVELFLDILDDAEHERGLFEHLKNT